MENVKKRTLEFYLEHSKHMYGMNQKFYGIGIDINQGRTDEPETVSYDYMELGEEMEVFLVDILQQDRDYLFDQTDFYSIVDAYKKDEASKEETMEKLKKYWE